MVCKLKKELYSLKQVLRAWFQHLNACLLHLGFFNRKFDDSLFFRCVGSSITIIFAYVDDILVIGISYGFIKEFVSFLYKKFALKDIGALSLFLEIEALCTSNYFHF